MRYFILQDPIGDRQALTLTGGEAHHVRHVLRLRVGQAIGLFDGSGRAFAGLIEGMDEQGVVLAVREMPDAPAESPLRLTILQGMLKEGKMDDLVRPLTELGVSCWVPFIARRSVARPDARRLAKRTERWRKISQQAQKQCRRPKSMEIDPAPGFEQALAGLPAACVKLIFYENAPTALEIPQGTEIPTEIAALVGPEGGFDPAEVRRAQQAGFEIAGLGRRILRAQTAALAIASILQNRFGDLG